MNAVIKGREDLLDLIEELTGNKPLIVSTPRVLIDLTGDLNAAIVLNQILFWSGKPKSRKRGGWFYKSYKDWKSETSLTQYQVSTAIKKLEKFGIQSELHRANGAPTLHYRFDYEVFTQSIIKFLDNGKFTYSIIDNEETEQSIDYQGTKQSITKDTQIKKTEDVTDKDISSSQNNNDILTRLKTNLPPDTVHSFLSDAVLESCEDKYILLVRDEVVKRHLSSRLNKHMQAAFMAAVGSRDAVLEYDVA